MLRRIFLGFDENRARMMCYKIIDPTVALDNGIEAYCYYIREYLEEVEVTDEKYQDYLLSLRIYVPSEALPDLPLKEIKHRLSDIAFKRIKKKTVRSVQFDVKKGEKHLRVQFLDYRELEQLITLQKKYEVKKMDKQLYYRIMVPASLLSVCLFFVPNFPIRSVIGFLVMFGGMGLIITFFIRKENLLLFI